MHLAQEVPGGKQGEELLPHSLYRGRRAEEHRALKQPHVDCLRRPTLTV